MRILLDSNIILRLGHHESPQHAETMVAIAKLIGQGAAHGLTNLLTFNRPDFARFARINVFTPADIGAGRLPN